jgi:hypothetical protein
MRLRLLPLLALVACLVNAAEPPQKEVKTADVPPAGIPTAVPVDSVKSDTLLLSAKYTNSLTLLPGADDAAIAKTFARLLERSHYSRHKFDTEISEKFFDRYLDVLDPQRVYFLQSDYDEFAPLRSQLNDVIMRQSDTTVAYDIFNRFLQRFDQSYALVMDLLRTNEFRFDGDDKFVLDRKTSPRPRDLAEAQKLWRDRLRSEYLAETLTAGDRQEVLQKFATNLATANWEHLTRYLTNKFSPEKSAELTKFARMQYEQAMAAQKPLVVNPGQADVPVNPVVEAVVKKVDERLAADTREEIVKKLTRRYNRSLRNLKQFESDEVLQFWLSALGHAYDPHTDYFGKRELESFYKSNNM